MCAQETEEWNYNYISPWGLMHTDTNQGYLQCFKGMLTISSKKTQSGAYCAQETEERMIVINYITPILSHAYRYKQVQLWDIFQENIKWCIVCMGGKIVVFQELITFPFNQSKLHRPATKMSTAIKFAGLSSNVALKRFWLNA